MLGASSARRRILLTYDFPMFSASEISVTEVYTPLSSSFCNRTRASAFSSVPMQGLRSRHALGRPSPLRP